MGVDGADGEQCAATLNLLKTHRDGETFFGIFDASNFNQSGDDCWENWLALRDYTDAMHLKDSVDDGSHTPIGQGNGHYQRIFADLVERGWTGPVVLEPHLQVWTSTPKHGEVLFNSGFFELNIALISCVKLQNSPAVVALEGSDNANQSLADLSQAAVYQVAAVAAKDCMGKAGAVWR